MKKYYQYILGFDNIRPGFNVYNSRSVFVSNKKTVTSPGQFGLKTTEWRPAQAPGSGDIVLTQQTYQVTDDEPFYHGTVEYYVTIRSFNSDGIALSIDTIPILPVGAQRVYHEQLIFTKKSDASLLYNNMGPLRFYCDAIYNDNISVGSNGVKVYRNGTLLNYGNGKDWIFVDPGVDPTLTLEGYDSGSRMCRGIQLLQGIQPLDIYTVSYTPATSNTRVIPVDDTLFNIIDLIGDESMRMLSDNLVLVEPTKYSQDVANADIYLTIIMRRNSAIETISPFVDEYMLLTSSRDVSKFEGKI